MGAKVASDEVVEVGALERVFFQREVLVGAEVVNPELGCPRFFLSGFAIEEEDVGLNSLRVDLNLLGAKNETGRPKAE